MSEVKKMLLGDGIFFVNDVAIGRTRGGGSFSVEREYREIEADGDYGAVKGRQRKLRSVPHLVLNALTIISNDLKLLYAATDVTTDAGTETFKAKADIEDSDYIDKVSFVGATKAGKQVVIEVYNALNLENIEWELVDKEEVVPEINYTGHYLESDRTTEPWKVDYAVGDTYAVTFNVDDGTNDVAGASVYFYNTVKATNISGVALFSDVAIGDNLEFKVVAGGFQTYYGSVNVVNAAVTANVTLTAI